MKKVFFNILNTAQTYELNTGFSLLNNLHMNKISTHGKCGGKAICGYCKIQITCGKQFCNKPLAEEKLILSEQELLAGWRLACQTTCIQNIALYMPQQEDKE